VVKTVIRSVVISLLLLAYLAGIAVAQATTQAPTQDKPVDMKQLVAEIAGQYSFELQGETVVLEFVGRDGALYGAQVGEELELCTPVPGKPLNFEVTVASTGMSFDLQFARNDRGVIDRCTVIVEGQVIEGTKIIKKATRPCA